MNKYLFDHFKINPDQPSPIRLPIGRWRGMTNVYNLLGYKVGAEIGVDVGHFSKHLCSRMPGLYLYCVDNWEFSRTYHVMHRYDHAKERLAHYPNAVLIRSTSMQALDSVPDGLDFVYIDADHHYDFVLEDITEWSKKVRPGGMVSGHDYFEVEGRPDIQVKAAVDEYVRSHQISPWFVTSDDKTSWMWIKP